MQNYYEILGINNQASYEDIKKAYRKKALASHPDKNIGNDNYDPEIFRNISNAYEILSNPEKRARYDIMLKMNKQGSTISQEDFLKAFGVFKTPSEVFNSFFKNIPIEYRTISNNLFNYFFEDKDKFQQNLNDFNFKGILSDFKGKLMQAPLGAIRVSNPYFVKFYKLIKITLYIYSYCAFYFYDQLTTPQDCTV